MMLVKIFLCFSCLFLGSVLSAHIPETRDVDIAWIIEDIILGELQKIPQPLIVKNELIHIKENEYVNGSLDVRSAIISGHHTGEIPWLNVSILELKVDGEIDFEHFLINTVVYQNVTYNATQYNDFVLASIVFRDLKIFFSGQYDVFSGHVRNLSVRANLGLSVLKFTGLLGDEILSDKISKTLTENLADWVNNDTTVFPKFSVYLEGVINDYLDSKKELFQRLNEGFEALTA